MAVKSERRDIRFWTSTETENLTLILKHEERQLCKMYIYTTFTNFSTKYLVMCNVYTDVGGIK